MRKKIDARVRTVIENGVRANHRSLLVLVGDRGKDQVVNLHYMLSKAQVKQRPSVLWCYKKELGFSSHRQKRMKQVKKMMQRGLLDPNKDDPFELFISSTNIRYSYYKESHKILGQTFGMLVLQDFEALTPNLLARTVETVEGGGVIVLLLRTMSSLKQLYTMAMDVHDRYRTEAHQEVVARFNERFLLSLTNCASCLVLDDELNVLPINQTHGIDAVPVPDDGFKTPEQIELEELKKTMEDTQPAGTLVKAARTLDQAKAILTFVEAISEKTLRSTVALTAGRGRGKSAALGVAMAAAVAYGYSNIFVTSPTPENLKTLFEFVFKSFDALGYEEHLDYDIVQSVNPAFNKAVVRVNIFREHRQTIQYIEPQDAKVLGQAELVVIDEAAAIPLPYVQALMGPYLVFMASTINGYEGTGRSLSLKLIKQLREQSVAAKTSADAVLQGLTPANKDGEKAASASKASAARVLREIKLEEPIRYASKDPVEKWLNQLLCLDANVVPRVASGCPHPSKCELFYVNRDTLFSYHPAAESFLQRIIAIYVSSHYKNSPNDLQLLSDAPAHNIFVLLPPMNELEPNSLPEVLAVVQVALEGEISKQSVQAQLNRGERASGDLIPWTISQQFQDSDFASLSGGRIVRIATHPDYQKMGYGSRALELLNDYYNGKFANVREVDPAKASSASASNSGTPKSKKGKEAAVHKDEEGGAALLGETDVQPRKDLPPLLSKLDERLPERLHYLGVSFGLTQQLNKFWKKSGYAPVYLRQTANELTGEYTMIMLRTLDRSDSLTIMSPTWLRSFFVDFQRRFMHLLSYQFRNFSPLLALEILKNPVTKSLETKDLGREELGYSLTPYDLKRIQSYSFNMVDHHVIVDLLPTISDHIFSDRLSAVHLSPVQSAILVALGLQHKTIEDVEQTLSLPTSQILALFNKVIRKVSKVYEDLRASAYDDVHSSGATLNKKFKAGDDDESGMEVDGALVDDAAEEEEERGDEEEVEFEPLEESLEDELNSAGNSVNAKLRNEQRKMIESLDLSQYAIGSGKDEDWEAALSASSKKRKGVPVHVAIPNMNGELERKKQKKGEAAFAASVKMVDKYNEVTGKKKGNKVAHKPK